jgi:hypothetical protein
MFNSTWYKQLKFIGKGGGGGGGGEEKQPLVNPAFYDW